MKTNIPQLIGDETLERSEVVANSSMNRDRGVSGVNGYDRDLSFNILDWIRLRVRDVGNVSWLDLCCGKGRALIEAAEILNGEGHKERISLHGIDLMPMFYPIPPDIDFLKLESASLHNWQESRRYDLITCVHGLHYIGDKLELIRKAVNTLADEGMFSAHLDLDQIILESSPNPPQPLLKTLRKAGLTYDGRKRLLACHGRRTLRLPFHYLGSDDRGGPNYTGQPAVTSYYAFRE